MIRLKDLLKESEEFQQLPTELKRHFLEIISTYGQHREGMTRKSDIRQVAETLGGIADAAQEYTLREGGDWFDRVTIKRNMSELKKLQAAFEKESLEAKAQEQRLESLYEDMGHVLGRYFEIADVSEDVMKSRLGLQECKSCKTPIKEARRGGVPMYNAYYALTMKVRQLEDIQKELSQKYFAEKDLNKKEALLTQLKKGTDNLKAWRGRMQKAETDYVMNLDRDAELEIN